MHRNATVSSLSWGLCAGALVAIACGCSCNGGSGGGAITSVTGWTVQFATETGEWISEKAQTFAAAVTRAWEAFWGPDKVNGVVLDENDPLRGTYDGILSCAVQWAASASDDEGNRMEIQLDHPRMLRESESTDHWELAPEEKQRIEELEAQLLQVEG